jgi:nicotinate dehydrogenase subunit B
MPIMQSSRRQLLQGAGGLVITFALGSIATRGSRAEPRMKAEATPGVTPVPFTADQTQEPVEMRDLTGDRVDSWLSIDQDGRVTIYVGKVELGTGLMTAIAQIAAEDLMCCSPR